MERKGQRVIKKLTRALGSKIGPSEWAPLPVVIGAIEQSETGNTIVRVGKMTITDPDANTGTWTQTACLVMVPEERDELIDVLTSQRSYQTIKVGDVAGSQQAIVLAVHYVNGAGGGDRRIGTVLAWDDFKREYIIWTADPYGDVLNGTYATDEQRALNAYAARLNDHLFRHFNSTPPTLTYAAVADRDKLNGADA
jgi:hypothetical protein